MRLEPRESLHHWNLAAAHQRLQRVGGAYLALRAYLDCGDDGEGANERCDEARKFVRAYERTLKSVHPGVTLSDFLRGEELFARAYAALGEGRHEEAARGFQAVLALVPRHYPSWGNLGAAQLELGQRRQALDSFSRALELNPEYAVARKNLQSLAEPS